MDWKRRVGEWSADRSTNELARGGEAVRIEPKAMEVLMALVARAGQVVSREDLLAAAWPGVVVGDEALTQTIIKLRRALGDNPRSPTYIETISKRGYRLIAPVGEAQVPPAPRARNWRNWRMFAAAAGVAVLAAVAAVFLSVARPPDAVEEVREDRVVTVTVMPFESLGTGTDHGYLGRGIGSDLMTDLSRLSGLRLVSPAGNARYVVSGTVQRDGESVRINVRLTDSRSKEQLWSQRYERPYGDILALQNEISRSVVEQLPGRISGVERRRLAQRHTVSAEAYDQFLRAQALFLVRRAEENREARVLYARAVELDPKFARAYAGLAMTHAMDYRYQESTDTALTRALELAETARLIDPALPDVHWALGFVHTQARRHDEAIRSLQKAVELNRSYADAYALLGGIYTYVGQPAKSIPLLRTALRLNPEGSYLYYMILGRAYLFENDVQQALINLGEARSRNPDDMETRLFLAAAYAADGNRFSAQWEADQIRAHQASFSTRAWLATYPLTSMPHKARLLQLLASVGL